MDFVAYLMLVIFVVSLDLLVYVYCYLFILLSPVMIRIFFFFYYNRWLLEVNASPSLTASSPDDYDLKCRLLDDVLNVVDLENRFVQLFTIISSSMCRNFYVILEPFLCTL